MPTWIQFQAFSIYVLQQYSPGVMLALVLCSRWDLAALGTATSAGMLVCLL